VANDTNGHSDVFVRDLDTGTLTRVSVSTAGVQGNLSSFEPSISADGRFVAFESDAATLVGGDTNAVRDVFVHDRFLKATVRLSRSAAGEQGNAKSENPSITGDGSTVAFQSAASNLVAGDTGGVTDVFVSKLSGSIVRASVTSSGVGGNDVSGNPAISADGAAVAFESRASNLTANVTPGRRHIYHHDLAARRTIRVVDGLSGVEGNGDSREPSISSNGRKVAYKSFATNLVFTEGNGSVQDVYVTNLDLPSTSRNTLASVGRAGAAANGLSTTAVITTDGRAVAFTSEASNLVDGDTNRRSDAFVRTLE
jgi:Tol biopolymer transport system component